MKPRFPLPRPARADRTILPALLAAGLVAMIAAQLALTGPVTLPVEMGVAGGARVATLADPPGSTVPLAILARPIFAPRSGGSTGSDTVEVSDPLGGNAIAGSVRIGRRAYVIVQTPSGASRRVAPGGTIAGWRIAGVGASEALLIRGSERLRVAYGTKTNEGSDAPASDEEDQP